jgi:hypothetical protein
MLSFSFMVRRLEEQSRTTKENIWIHSSWFESTGCARPHHEE